MSGDGVQRALDAELEAEAWRRAAARHRKLRRKAEREARAARKEAAAAALDVARLVDEGDSLRVELATSAEKLRLKAEALDAAHAAISRERAANDERVMKLRDDLSKRADQESALLVIAQRLGVFPRPGVALWRDIDAKVVALLLKVQG